MPTPVPTVVGVRLESVSAGYGRRRVLNDVTLQCDPGRALRVVGGNGTGKSTLLKVAAGVISPWSGRVTGPRRREVGYAPAGLTVAGRLTAQEYLEHVTALKRHPADGWEEVESLAATLGLQPGLGHRIDELSTGNRQIVNLIQALASSPRLLVLDEPFAALAPPVVKATVGLLRAAMATGTTVLYCDHGGPPLGATFSLDPTAADATGPRVMSVTDARGRRRQRAALPVPGREGDFLQPGDVVASTDG